MMVLGVTRHVPPSNDAGVVLTTLAEMDACVEQVAIKGRPIRPSEVLVDVMVSVDEAWGHQTA